MGYATFGKADMADAPVFRHRALIAVRWALGALIWSSFSLACSKLPCLVASLDCYHAQCWSQDFHSSTRPSVDSGLARLPIGHTKRGNTLTASWYVLYRRSDCADRSHKWPKAYYRLPQYPRSTLNQGILITVQETSNDLFLQHLFRIGWLRCILTFPPFLTGSSLNENQV